MHVCLRAARADGCLELERDSLAREVGKSRSTLGRCLRELQAKRICELEPAANQKRRARLRVCPEYWPYEVEPQPDARPASDVCGYVAEVRRRFCQPACCVQGRLGLADERLATDWHRQGVSLQTVQRAILLRSVRKTMSWLDRPGSEPVRSLRYFASLVEEVQTESFPDSYWPHLEFSLRRCERIRQGGWPRCPGLPVHIWHRQGRAQSGPHPQQRQRGRRRDDDD